MRTFLYSLALPLLSLSFGTTAAQPQSALTPFEADYRVMYGDIGLGKAHFSLPQGKDNYYEYLFTSELSLLILSDERSIKSKFRLTERGLEPMVFNHQRTGTGPDFSEQVAFLKDKSIVRSNYKGEHVELPFTDKLFDTMMVQLQFRMDLLAGSEKLEYHMVKDNEVDEYSFKRVGPEAITIDGKTYNTLKLEVIRDNNKRKTVVWMAPELAYLPVRMTHFEKGDKQLDVQLTGYRFTQTPAAVSAN
ncbi:DUF3108 domain-containing protein [Shewanella sp. JM162201]|uniref:DUF3108 domain-containing protein n=1 Tax=Shewanella jiangmenensis TaxID=2837387 RepID=A0ABS5V7P9_9GAMM|nr:DUF3108 domain-containing protein [Shewanella jiangmenensis]MBT1445988.1 DUF3108 domain-containing protein [Shewanella jiangmenensis]